MKLGKKKMTTENGERKREMRELNNSVYEFVPHSVRIQRLFPGGYYDAHGWALSAHQFVSGSQQQHQQQHQQQQQQLLPAVFIIWYAPNLIRVLPGLISYSCWLFNGQTGTETGTHDAGLHQSPKDQKTIGVVKYFGLKFRFRFGFGLLGSLISCL